MVNERTWVWQLMKVHAGANNPWSWDSVTDAVRADLIERLPVFVADYNRLYVTKPSQLVPRCWPLHPALAREVAVLYATWLASFHEDTGAAHNGAYWFDRWLPGFQGRIQDWLGKEPDACRAGQHPDNWNDVAALIGRHTTDLDEVSGQLRDLPYLMPTASTPSNEGANPDAPATD